MGQAAKLLTRYIVNRGMIKEDEFNTYEYGFTVMLETGLSIVISVCMAAALHMTIEGVLFFLIFIPLRSYAGGLHLEKYWACLTLSCLTFVTILLIVKYIEIPILITLLFLAATIPAVYFLYPVENKNRPVDKEENQYFKGRLKIYLLFDCLIAGICFIFKKESWFLLITATFLMIVITMLLGKIKSRQGIKI